MDEIETMINDCMMNESKLNDWERHFIDSIYDKYTNDKKLTIYQENKLEEIWDALANR